MKTIKSIFIIVSIIITNNCYCQISIDSIELVSEKITDYQDSFSLSNSLNSYLESNDLWFVERQSNILLYKRILNCDTCLFDSIYVYINYNELFEREIIKTTYKKFHTSFSSNNTLLVINYLDDRPEYYDAALDDYFWIYNLDSLANGILHKDSIYCKYCDDGYIVGNKLFYTRSNVRDDFQGGYWLTDIYVSPFGNIADSIVIARNFGIRAISSDGKYILAQNKNTIDRYSCAIIDVESKHYQVLLGRDYYNRQVVYSDEGKKFGFVFGKKIVYVDMPQTYPFDALEKKDIFWPRPVGIEKKYEKPPLE